MINHNKNAWRLVLPFEILMIIKTVFAYDASSINVSNSLPDAACSVKGGGGVSLGLGYYLGLLLF